MFKFSTPSSKGLPLWPPYVVGSLAIAIADCCFLRFAVSLNEERINC